MKENYKKVTLFICLSILLCGCGKKKIPDVSMKIRDIDSLSKYSIEELDMDIKEIDIGNRVILGSGTIGNDGNILLGNIPRSETADSIIYLFNVEDSTDVEIDRTKATRHFSFAFQDKEVIIYFKYSTWGISAIPEEYYIYDKNTKTIESMNMSESINVHKELIIDTTMVRINQDLYFEVQDRAPTYKENENAYDDNGASIYKYNLITKEFSFVTRGMSPRVYNGELIYIKDHHEAKIITMDGEVIVDSVIDYHAYNDTIVAVRYADQLCQMLLIQDGKEKKIFDRKYDERFWEVYTNGDFVTWMQQGGDSGLLLCFYDIKKDSLITIPDTSGGQAQVTGKYLHWSSSTLDPQDKNGGETTIYYVEFE